MIMDKRCAYCHGQGSVPDPHGVLSPKMACPVCGGRGFNLVPRDANHCGFCRGNGRIVRDMEESDICPDCGGIGYKW
jgi:DnaJ-class molecular chaperone